MPKLYTISQLTQYLDRARQFSTQSSIPVLECALTLLIIQELKERFASSMPSMTFWKSSYRPRDHKDESCPIKITGVLDVPMFDERKRTWQIVFTSPDLPSAGPVLDVVRARTDLQLDRYPTTDYLVQGTGPNQETEDPDTREYRDGRPVLSVQTATWTLIDAAVQAVSQYCVEALQRQTPSKAFQVNDVVYAGHATGMALPVLGHGTVIAVHPPVFVDNVGCDVTVRWTFDGKIEPVDSSRLLTPEELYQHRFESKPSNRGRMFDDSCEFLDDLSRHMEVLCKP